MEVYLLFAVIILVIFTLPRIRVIYKRIILLSKLKKVCTVKYNFFDVFLPTRFCRGFVIDGKYTVHIFASYRKNEKIHLLPDAWQVEIMVNLIGGIAIVSQNWFTVLRRYPKYIKNRDENTLLLFNPAPHSIYDLDKNRIFGLHEGDKILDMEIVTMTTLLDKFIKSIIKSLK